MSNSVLLYPAVLVRQWDLLKSFIWRDLAARYEGSMLGRLWPIVYPLLLLGLYHLIFAQFLGLKLGDKNELVPGAWSTTFYLLSGILPWLVFADTLAKSTNVVIENSNLIKKIAFPSELLPTFVSCAQMVHGLISLGLFVILYAVVNLTGVSGVSFEDGMRLCGNMLFLPIPLLLQFVFGLGFGMLLASLNVFFRDINQVIPIGLLMWMLVSPIFYPIAMVEKQVAQTGETWILTVMNLNPIYHLLVMYRAVFPAELGVRFPWPSCLIFAVISLAFFLVGHWFFVRTKHLFSDEV